MMRFSYIETDVSTCSALSHDKVDRLMAAAEVVTAGTHAGDLRSPV